VLVGVLVGVLDGVLVGMLVGVAVGVLVGVSVGVAVGVSVGVLVGVFVGVAVGVSVGVAVRVGVAVGVSVAAPQTREMTLVSSVTAPVCAIARPFSVAPVFKEMDVSARMFPINVEFVSSVAELPTRHHTLQGSSPVTDEPDELMSVDADLKIQTPEPDRARSPLNMKDTAQ